MYACLSIVSREMYSLVRSESTSELSVLFIENQPGGLIAKHDVLEYSGWIVCVIELDDYELKLMDC